MRRATAARSGDPGAQRLGRIPRPDERGIGRSGPVRVRDPVRNLQSGVDGVVRVTIDEARQQGRSGAGPGRSFVRDVLPGSVVVDGRDTPIGIDQDIDVLARLVGDPIDQPDVRDDQPGARRASGLMRCRGRSPER